MKSFIKTLILVVTTIATLLPIYVETAKILAVFPFPNPLQYNLVLPYLKALAARGHEMTVINAFPQKQPLKNYRDVLVPEVYANYFDLSIESNIERGNWDKLTFISDFCYNITESVLKNTNVQNLLNVETFDLVIIEVLRTDALYSFGRHFNAPMIGLSNHGTEIITDELMGNMSPLSYTPAEIAGLREYMTFIERLVNAIITFMDYWHMRWVELPKQEKLLRKYLPHIKEDLVDLRTNFSLMLLNQYFGLSYPRPYVSNMIDVGGLHIHYTPQALPKDIMDFLSDSSADVIYFSMGSYMKSKDFPPAIIKMFTEVFASLPYKILWKFEAAELPGKPKNVFISSWFPQEDILAHPRVKLFIYHGGLLSSTEALYHGKPIIAFPLFSDHLMNIRTAIESGYALALNLGTLTGAEFKASILEFMNNPKYIENAKRKSSIYHDRPIKPLDLAIYWTEYVLRHRGAVHLQNPAQKMNFLQKHSIDTVGVFLFVFVTLTSLVTVFIWNWLKYAFIVQSNKKIILENLREREIQ